MSPTPILDLHQSPPEPSRQWLPRIIGLVIGAVIGVMWILAENQVLPQLHWPALNVFLLIPALYGIIAVHELGHVLAGKLAGVDTGGISVGAFRFVKSGGNWTFRFDRTTWTAGFVLPLSASPDFPRSRYAWMVAGGPLASLACAVVFAWIWQQQGDGAWDWVGTLLWTSLLSGAFAIIPFSAGLNRSDGAQLWQLVRHPEQARSWMAVIALQTEETNGVRPREWNATVVERILKIDASVSEYPYCQLLAFYRRLDEGLEEQALQHLENALASSARAGRPMRHVLFLTAASASAFLRKQAGPARTWRERACKLRRPESSTDVDAGIAMCEGHYQEAMRHWEAARAYVARRKLDSGIIRFAQEKWRDYEEACKTSTR